MTDHTHFRRECEHGRVWSQCRCAGPKPVTIVPCSDVACPGDAAPAMEHDVVAMLRALADDTLHPDETAQSYMLRFLASDRDLRTLMPSLIGVVQAAVRHVEIPPGGVVDGAIRSRLQVLDDHVRDLHPAKPPRLPHKPAKELGT